MKKESVRLNDYSGSEWAKASLSVLKFNGTTPLKRKEHGAAFPFTLAKHFISTYSKKNDLIFDPFVGVGTTTDAAVTLGRKSIGMDINKKFIKLAKTGPDSIDLKLVKSAKGKLKMKSLEPKLICDDAENMKKYVKKNSVDLILTSPPYGNLLRMIRPNFADKMLFKDKDKKKVNRTVSNPQAYSNKKDDLGNMIYTNYLAKIQNICKLTFEIAKSNSYAIWVVKDYRDIKNKTPYVNLHGDLINVAQDEQWKLWDVVVWDQSERRPLVVLGYPSKNFYANIGHSFVIILKKQ